MSGVRPLHAGRTAAVTVLLLAGLLLASWFAPVVGIAPATPVFGAATDLTIVTDTTYTVQPDHHRVRVGMTLVAKNNTRESRTKRFFFDHAFLAVLPGASDVKITGAKGARVHVVRRTANSSLLRIDFGSRLYSGKSRTLKVAFNLVDPGKPAERQLRVGSSLVTLPVWAHASTGARGSTVKVRIPKGYDVAVETGAFAKRTTVDGGATELQTGRLANPLSFFAYVSAQKPAVYAESPLTVPAGDESIALTMRAWQDDPAWAKRTGSLFAKALPILRKDIDLPWPTDEPTIVEEAASRVSGGFEGTFDPAANRIEVAYWADPQIVIHEMAHRWFNGALLADRWANEGFAQWYALRAATATKQPAVTPVVTKELAAAAIPLNAWPAQAPADPDASAEDAAAARLTEAFGYAASYEFASAVAERAGEVVLRSVWADAAAGVGAYQPIDPTTGAYATTASQVETVAGPPDWRGLLDLLEARTGADFTDLWLASVVRPEEAALLDARAQARLSYERTLALADGWTLPRSIRDALRAWQFDLAEQLMADARTVIAQRGAVTGLAAQRGLELPDAMRPMFESGRMTDASAQAESERNAMLAIGQADEARSAEKDVLTRIGMIGENPAAKLDAAKAALAEGDIDQTLSAADDAYRAWTGAWQEGRRRALLGLALLATLVVLASAVFGRIRGQRGRRVAHAGTGATPSRGRSSGAVRAAAASLADADPTPEELLAASTPPAPPSA